jgi:hypothetical protein
MSWACLRLKSAPNGELRVVPRKDNPFVPSVGMEGYFFILNYLLGGANMKQQLENIRLQALTSLDAATSPVELEELRVKWLGKRAS